MKILPAWLIEELKKLEELRRQQQEQNRPRLYIEPPPAFPYEPTQPQEVEESDDDDYKIVIPLR